MIAAPGKDSGSGEVFLFEGDPTQPTFGNLLLDIANPHPQAGAQFGAAVAGIGANLIVGAPFDNTAGTGAGIVYLFSGTTGAQTAAIVNPRPSTSTGFGSAVASVGPNVLIGSPLDNTVNVGAGAAFLYGPTGTLLLTFTQPDGGGGHFGASVAGSGTTALIGARGPPSARTTPGPPTSSTPTRRARSSAGRSPPSRSPPPSRETPSAAPSGSSTSTAPLDRRRGLGRLGGRGRPLPARRPVERLRHHDLCRGRAV